MELPPSKRGIAMVFQSYALYPSMTVEKNLSFGLRMMNVSKSIIQEKIKKASELLQIGDLLHRKPSQLSGGQRQRVAIGRALVRDAKVFLFASSYNFRGSCHNLTQTFEWIHSNNPNYCDGHFLYYLFLFPFKMP